MIIYLELQNWQSKLQNLSKRLWLHEPSRVYAQTQNNIHVISCKKKGYDLRLLLRPGLLMVSVEALIFVSNTVENPAHCGKSDHRKARLTTVYWKPNYKDLYGNLSQVR